MFEVLPARFLCVFVFVDVNGGGQIPFCAHLNLDRFFLFVAAHVRGSLSRSISLTRIILFMGKTGQVGD